MDHKLLKKILTWFLALTITLAAMSFSSRLYAPPAWWPDLFWALGAFCSYYFADKEATYILVLLGFLKDLLFSTILGPTALVAILVYWLSFFALDLEKSKSWYRGLFFAAGWIFLAKILQPILFSLLPARTAVDQALSVQLSWALRGYASCILLSLLAYLVYLGLFRWLYPDFNLLGQDDDLQIAESPGRLL